MFYAISGLVEEIGSEKKTKAWIGWKSVPQKKPFWRCPKDWGDWGSNRSCKGEDVGSVSGTTLRLVGVTGFEKKAKLCIGLEGVACEERHSWDFRMCCCDWPWKQEKQDVGEVS